jgi:hypothetical protein
MKESAITIARKQRHILLLQKVKDNKALTPKEVQELEGYEAKHQAAEAAQPQAASQPAKSKTPRAMEASIRHAGFECESIEAAAERLGVADIESLLTGKPKLAVAWERGRFLRQVRAIATETLVVADEVDRFLVPALERGRFAELLKCDKTLHDVWTSGRALAATGPQRGLKRLADAGDARAMSIYERLLVDRSEAGAGRQIEWDNLTPTQLEQATGIKRNQWRRWEEKHGCPRRANRRYSLPAVIEWLREHEATGGIRLEHGLNPLQAEKVRRERMANDENEGRLMETDLHVEEICRRARCLAALLSAERAQEWSLAFAGKTEAQLREIILPAFEKVVDEYEKIPDDVTLPAAARAKFEEGFQLLRVSKPQMTTNERDACHAGRILGIPENVEPCERGKS